MTSLSDTRTAVAAAAGEVVAVPPSPRRRRLRLVWWAVAGIMVASVCLECWAVQRDLPYADVDEPVFVGAAVHIAASGDLDPHWFGHPGSTTIYPLAGAYHVWDAVAHGGPVFAANPRLEQRFRTSPSEFYLLGRLWSIAFAVAALPLIFVLGRRCFSTAVGLIGAALWALIPLAVQYGRTVRTDSAGVFFVLLALVLMLRLLERPTLRNHVLAGLSIGLGVSSRYFLVTLVPVLVAVGVIAVRRRLPGAKVRNIAVGLGAAVGGFALTTPYFVLDRAAVAASLRLENATHYGHDGLSPLGNLRWYFTDAIPHVLSWPVALLAFAGIGLAVARARDHRVVLLLGASAVFLIAISTSKLHWNRWPIPILPVIVLFAAYAVVSAASAVSAATRHGTFTPVAIGCLMLAALWPAKNLVQMNIRQSRPSTRVVARHWIEQHVPPASIAATEIKTAPLRGTRLHVTGRYSLALGRTLDDYRREGVQYLVTNDSVTDHFTNAAARYPTEAAFYRRLRRQACLLHVFRPNWHRDGPVIRVFSLPARDGNGCP